MTTEARCSCGNALAHFTITAPDGRRLCGECARRRVKLMLSTPKAAAAA